MKALTYPAWFNGPDGQSAVFEAADDVPKGWTSGAEKQSLDGAAKAASAPAETPAKVETPAPIDL